MSADPEHDIITIVGPLDTGQPLEPETAERHDRAVAGVMGLVARGWSLEQAARTLRVDGRAVALDDVLVTVGAFPDRPPVPKSPTVRLIDEAWTTSSGHRCRVRRPLHPGGRYR